MTVRGSMPGVLMPQGKPYLQKKGKKTAQKKGKNKKAPKNQATMAGMMKGYGPRRMSV